MSRAIRNDTVIAESDDIVMVEGNHYFPASSVRADVLAPSAKQTTCPWKGVASYHTVVVNGQRNEDAAWFYAAPKDAAAQITGRVAFWKGVRIEP
jgi:uncharacterized protein (DUF427 family)